MEPAPSLKQNVAQPKLPSPTDHGWKYSEGRLVPIMMTLSRPILEGCLEMITCQCKTGWKTLRCKCRKSRLYCTPACKPKCMELEDVTILCTNKK